MSDPRDPWDSPPDRREDPVPRDPWAEPLPGDAADFSADTAGDEGTYALEDLPADPAAPPPPPRPPHTAAYAGVTPAGVRCIRCGYDLTGATLGGFCGECGTPVSQSLGYGQGRPSEPASGLAITAMVLGIISVMGMPLAGPVAIFLAVKAKRDASPGSASAGMAQAGLITGIIGSVFLCCCAGWFSMSFAPLFFLP